MSDSPDLGPEQDAVRRLLADARHDVPVPPEVVARLDETLASLVAERGSEPSDRDPAPVVDLRARRRRTAGIGLLAAAAVVVAGVALGQALPRSGSNDAGSAGGSAADSTASQELRGQSDDAGSAGAGPESLKSASPAPLAAPLLSTTDADLDEQVLQLRSTAAERVQAPTAADAELACSPSGTGRGRKVAAQVDGRPGLVVFRRPAGESQEVAIYVCGEPAPVRTLTLPAP